MSLKIHLVGNGESRKDISLDNLNGFKLGCNAVFRDSVFDSIVAIDERIVNEALLANVNVPIYTRKEWIPRFQQYPNVKSIIDLPYQGDKREDDPWHWGTGTHAANLAGSMQPQEIHLWGFDLWDCNGKVNNIYKNTKNYNDASHHGVDPRYWIYQLAKCFECYPEVTWIQNQKNDWHVPLEWKDFKNLKINVID